MKQRGIVADTFSVGATTDTLWEALVYNARNPQKFMDVSDVSVTDCKGFLGRTMTVNASKGVMTEHIYASERKGEISYRIVDPDSNMRETDDERVIAVKEEPLRLVEFFHRIPKTATGCSGRHQYMLASR